MTPLIFLALCMAGGVGAALRFLVDGLVKTRTNGSYPWGTTLINISGSFLLGLVTGLALSAVLPENLRLIVGTGFLGGYTTFSTASFETIRLTQERRTVAAAANGLGMLAASVTASAIGWAVGTW
ncbi:chromosome condensation protein CrcB [Microbacterium oxydans]|uniref:fluoride efflux transporter CrcB n=1 Tax=Microbacterium oxydans TaxID=82380 RepID=UPI0007346568|nr:fluoride efflux transporter CrcB [Microbacterium oxydans]KTR76795.1 chromosome condensation protein CrcB [Microbacterium oxydans]